MVGREEKSNYRLTVLSFPYNTSKKIFVSAQESFVPIELNSPVAIISDTHLNTMGGHNDSEKNLPLLRNVALPYYLRNNFRFILNGDIVDLWESKWYGIYKYNQDILDIFLTYALAWCKGNHDDDVDKFCTDFNRFCNGVILMVRGKPVGSVWHGHQIDPGNCGNNLTDIIRWFIRVIWTRIQQLIYRQQLPYEYSPAKNKELALLLDNNLRKLTCDLKELIVSGHTHSPSFTPCSTNEGVFINSGCWVNQGGGHVLEYVNSKFQLVTWGWLDKFKTPIRIVYDGYKMIEEPI